MKQYEDWIQANYPTQRESYGKCKDAAHAMKAAFPEIRITNGFVDVVFWNCGPREHWWCVSPDGDVVDPSRAQFPGPIEYEEIDDSHPARKYPLAKCMNCGEYYYAKPEMKGLLHNDRCDLEFRQYLNGDRDGD